mmetsp:Transcript_7798/g.8923  ORF Transcript_7798/g.8923 Transcript_7798/m.8923 type:complete len:222 (-) Transcript_7798:1135-1800(-)
MGNVRSKNRPKTRAKTSPAAAASRLRHGPFPPSGLQRRAALEARLHDRVLEGERHQVSRKVGLYVQAGRQGSETISVLRKVLSGDECSRVSVRDSEQATETKRGDAVLPGAATGRENRRVPSHAEALRQKAWHHFNGREVRVEKVGGWVSPVEPSRASRLHGALQWEAQQRGVVPGGHEESYKHLQADRGWMQLVGYAAHALDGRDAGEAGGQSGRGGDRR